MYRFLMHCNPYISRAVRGFSDLELLAWVSFGVNPDLIIDFLYRLRLLANGGPGRWNQDAGQAVCMFVAWLP